MKHKTNESAGVTQMLRLQDKIIGLGGAIPQPWLWAIVKQSSKGVIVDAALYNLQLLELLEDLEKKAVRA